MNEMTINCPKCGAAVKLNESLAEPFIAAMKQQTDRKIAAKDAEIAQREAAVAERLEKLAAEKKGIDARVAEQLKAQQQKFMAEESARQKLLMAADTERAAREMAELRDVLAQREEKLAEAQAKQADALRKERELDDARREMQVTIETRVNEMLAAARAAARTEAEEQSRQKVRDKEAIIVSMQVQIEDLRRKSEQGSQQLQGEVQELELETTLRDNFKYDQIEPVGKGEFGGDILHRVMMPNGRVCGTILWESKRTKAWSDGWLGKLRDDQRRASADVAAIVSQALPKDVRHFNLVDNVWIVDPKCVVAMALVLRQLLIEVSSARAFNDGQQTKMEMVYQYLVGPRFRQRVEAIVEKFSDMSDDLEKERTAMNRLWDKRAKQIRCVLDATSGFYGDLQGIAGKNLAEIDGLSFKELEGPPPGKPDIAPDRQ